MASIDNADPGRATPQPGAAGAGHRCAGRSLAKHCVAVLFLALALADASEAAVDVTGDWYMAVGAGPVVLLHLVQTGSSLQAYVEFPAFPTGSGTVDTTTGAFTLTFLPIGGFCGASFQAQVGTDGLTFTGTVLTAYTPPDCHGGIACACSATTSGPLYGSRSPCGNGIVDPGEVCDNATLGRNGDCCSATCQGEPSSTSCIDGNPCTAGDHCDGLGACVSGTCDVGATCGLVCGATLTCKQPEPGVCKCG